MVDGKTEAHLLAFMSQLRADGKTHISMGALIAKCDKEILAPFLMALSLLTLIPLIATPAGLLSSLLYWQMLTAKTISPTSWLGRRPVSLNIVAGAIDRFNRFEDFLGPYIPSLWPRLCFEPILFNLHCCYGLLCSLGIIVPIPGINYLFGPSLLLLSLAFVHANGLLLLLTYGLFPALFLTARKIVELIH